MEATDEEVAQCYQHQEEVYGQGLDTEYHSGFCIECGNQWPCMTTKLLARLERVEEELQRVRAELHGEW